MSQNSNTAIAIVGIDIGKNSFHVVGLDQRGAIVLRCSGVSQQPGAMGQSLHILGIRAMSAITPRASKSLRRTK